jgi:hypothetical protein
MLKKIISNGETGVAQAALEISEKLGIPYGGSIPKGRKTKTGSLFKRDKLQEISLSSNDLCNEQNVIDSDGTLILSHGELRGDSDYSRRMAEKHRRPWIHIDLDITTPLDSALKISSWAINNRIMVLNIVGPSAVKDPPIYSKTKEIVEGIIYLIQIRDKDERMETLSADALVPRTVSEAVSRLISKLPLKDKATIANMTVDELDSLQVTLGRYLFHFFKLSDGNKELIASCRFVSKKEVPNEEAASMIILTELWDVLRKTHKLRTVK